MGLEEPSWSRGQKMNAHYIGVRDIMQAPVPCMRAISFVRIIQQNPQAFWIRYTLFCSRENPISRRMN